MKTFKMFLDFDKEEGWLNSRAAEGWLLSGVGLRYTFAPIAPGSAVVRVDYRPSMSAADFDDYRNLFWDAGWRHVGGTRSSGNQYFASNSTDPDAAIFSDETSKAQRYRRAAAVSSALLLPFLIVTFALWSQGLLSPDLYLTPGLWQMEGWQFVGAFAFETPFVLLRISAPVLLVGVCLIFTGLIAYQWLLYRRAMARAAI